MCMYDNTCMRESGREQEGVGRRGADRVSESDVHVSHLPLSLFLSLPPHFLLWKSRVVFHSLLLYIFQVHIRVIPQSSSSSSSSSSGISDSESGSNSSRHSSPSPPPPSHPPILPPSHSPWHQPVRSEDEESTSSSAGGGLKLKLKISKALLQNVSSELYICSLIDSQCFI